MSLFAIAGGLLGGSGGIFGGSGFLGLGSKQTTNPAIIPVCDLLYKSMVEAMNSGNVALVTAHNNKVRQYDDQYDNVKEEELTLKPFGLDRISNFLITDSAKRWVGIMSGFDRNPQTWTSKALPYTPSTGNVLTIKLPSKENLSTGSGATSKLTASLQNIPTLVWWIVLPVGLVAAWLIFKKLKKKGRR